MSESHFLSSLRGIAAALLVAGSAWGTAVAAPTMIGTTVTATFTAPDNSPAPLFSESRAIGGGVEFAAGNTDPVLGTNGVGVQETIDFGPLTISLVLVDGIGDGSTGWGPGANWVFSGLGVGPDDDITGATITSNSGFSNFSASWVSFLAPDTVSLDVGSMRFTGSNTADRVGRLTITLATQATCTGPNCGGGGGTVPEPTTLALVGLGLLAASRARRRFAA